MIPFVLVCWLAAEGFLALLPNVFDPVRNALLERGVTSSTTEWRLLLRWLAFCTIVGLATVGYLRIALFAVAYLFVLEAWVLRYFVTREGLWELFNGIESAPVIGRTVERKVKRLAEPPSFDL